MATINTNPPRISIDFKAQWTPSTQYLNPANRSLAKKVYDCVKGIVFFIPNAILERIIRWAILPSSLPLLKYVFFNTIIKKWHEQTDSIESLIDLNMTTPDNIPIKGQFLKHPLHDTNPNSRVIILFHGNAALYQNGGVSNWMGNLLKDSATPYSFLLFNPRGVGESKQGKANPNNILLDSETAYQLVKDHLKVSEDRIDLYGQSIGGAEAADLKKLHPKTGGKTLLDRTFSTLDIEVADVLGGLPRFIQKFALYLVKKYGWEFDNYKALEKVKDPVHIFYHKKDSIIPEHCSLAKAVLDKNPNPANIFVYEYNNDPVGNSDGALYHNYPLDQLNCVDPRYHSNSKGLLRDIFENKVKK